MRIHTAIAARAERAQNEINALIEDIASLDDEAVDDAEIRKAKNSIDRLRAMIASMDTSAEQLREMIANFETAAEALEQASADLTTATDDLEALE